MNTIQSQKAMVCHDYSPLGPHPVIYPNNWPAHVGRVIYLSLRMIQVVQRHVYTSRSESIRITNGYACVSVIKKVLVGRGSQQM